MSIWFRGQDKSILYHADNIWVEGNGIYASPVGIGDDVCIGRYNSESEVIKVLDMIQRHINDFAYVQYTGSNVDFVPPVFQMPPAGFSEEG